MANGSDPIRSRRNVLKAIAGTGTVGMLAGCAGGGGGGSGDGSSGDGGGDGSSDGGDGSSGGGGTTTSGGSEEQDTYTLKMAESATQANPHYKGSKMLAETVNEKSDGRIQLDVICCGKAGGPPQITKSINSGTLDMGVSAVNNLAGLTDAWLFIQLPYLWKDHENLYDFWSEAYGPGGQGEIVSEINQKAKENLPNVNILEYWGSGGGSMRHMHFSNDSKPKVPSDADGEKIRVTESPVEKTTVSEWGFSPTPIAWTETTPAMKQGVIQGIHLHWWWLHNSGMYEQINYSVKTYTQDSPSILQINNESWNSLPSDLQDVMMESVKEVTPKQIETDMGSGQEARKMVEEKNSDIEIYEPTDSELAKWQEVTSPAYDEWIGKSGVKREYIETALNFQDHSVPGIDL
jgi:TRAP-type C4-dicarboxylate transport system substrate-binding protein